MDILNISDLQMSLIIVGIIIIIGVVIFNWVQQLRYLREARQASKHKQADILSTENKPVQENDRIEPRFNKKFMQEIQGTPAKIAATNKSISKEANTLLTTLLVDNAINYVVTIQPRELIMAAHLRELFQHKFDADKPVYWYGKDNDNWEEITRVSSSQEHSYTQLKGCLQLVDRSGYVSELSLSKFRDLAQEIATQLDATADCPDIMTIHEQAVLLDKFCAEVDIMIGINIISRDEGAFIGTKIRALAEASGFKLTPEGEFKYFDDNNMLLFTLNNYESEPFSPDNMKSLTTQGVTFLLDVPRVASGEKAFEQMIYIARTFSTTLGGIMVDDNRALLSDNGITRSKQQLSDIQANMKAHTFPAGSDSAMKLFS